MRVTVRPTQLFIEALDALGNVVGSEGPVTLNVPNSFYLGFTGGAGNATGTQQVRNLNISNAVPGRYVALGDSFSSGEGNPPFDAGTNTPRDHCRRSSAAYAHVLNGADPATWPLGATDFVACSGATRQNLVFGSPANHEGSQLDKLDASVAAVTLSIGGNDVNFKKVLQQCIYGAPPVINGSQNCGPGLQKGEDALLQSLYMQTATAPSLADLYGLIHQKAPAASIYVMLYPHLFSTAPPSTSCDLFGHLNRTNLPPGLVINASGSIRISRANMLWINREADQLDSAIIAEAQKARSQGVPIVVADPRAAFDTTDGGKSPGGHGACTSEPWVNGLVLHPTDGINYYKNNSFHPNASGQAQFAKGMSQAALSRGAGPAESAPLVVSWQP